MNPVFPPPGPTHAWDAGVDGRAVLDPLCAHAPGVLAPGGTLLLVHSEFAGEEASIAALRGGGLDAEVIGERMVPFGPVLSARARWLEGCGLLDRGRRVERLVAIAATAPDEAHTGAGGL